MKSREYKYLRRKSLERHRRRKRIAIHPRFSSELIAGRSSQGIEPYYREGGANLFAKRIRDDIEFIRQHTSIGQLDSLTAYFDEATIIDLKGKLLDMKQIEEVVKKEVEAYGQPRSLLVVKRSVEVEAILEKWKEEINWGYTI